jgi:apolipoprotein N-acyltransferase
VTFLVAFVAGAASVLGFSPFDLFLVGLAAFALLAHLWLRSAASPFLIGFFFGLGQFLAGVSWVYVSLHRFGGLPAPVAGFATLGFCAFLALFPAAAGGLLVRFPEKLRALSLPPLWVLLEWLRGTILTGFPWLTMGTAAVDSPLAGFAPLGGAYLVSLAVLSAAVLLWMVAAGHSRRAAAVAFAALGVGGWILGQLNWTEPARRPVSVALLQGNIEQSLKFDPARYPRTLEAYGRLAEESRARLIVLPETAVPRFLDTVERDWLQRLETVARRNGGDVLFGVPMRYPPDRYYNSVMGVGVSGPKVYDKVHLVPFGEFVPFGFAWFTRMMNIPLADFSRGLTDQRPLEVAGERVAVNICYEDAYGAEIARMLPQATLLVNVSNVAWFGDSLAPAQHLQIARMRALETGRMHLTATNTGITAAIDADGRVLARLPQFSEGRLEVEARGRTGATPYVRMGDWGALLLCVLWLAGLALAGRRRA